jgi:hypothetical protein
MRFDFANTMPSLGSWFIVGIMSVTFITFMKFLFGMYEVPGLSSLFASI